VETREDVAWLRRAVQALLDQHGISIEGAAGSDT
jgi:hypothetical protein